MRGTLKEIALYLLLLIYYAGPHQRPWWYGSIGGMTAEDEPSHPGSYKFCCHMTDGRRGVV